MIDLGYNYGYVLLGEIADQEDEKDEAVRMFKQAIKLDQYEAYGDLAFYLLGWTAKRELSKINYRIHTDAIKSHLIPEEITSAQASVIYAEEADVLNVAMFGMTARIFLSNPFSNRRFTIA